ncbi:uncharacterized protein LOC134300742 [Trichomycterus rosablanca]|uniref:uncharacterized protein LOC134300742 n=1 Tax=Trichomycterus rosablanca TaxID=2290929 RepID=UPI002F35E9FA
MRYTFKSDNCMVITIPLTSIRNAQEGQIMPEKFTCKFRDVYKVFLRGRPKAIGVAQIITAVFIICLGGILINSNSEFSVYFIPSLMFIPCGILTFAAGHTPIMCLMKMSYVLNIIGVFTAILGPGICLFPGGPFESTGLSLGLQIVIMILYVLEFLLSVIMIYWESKAVCRTHFNSLPMVTLKQDM